MRTSADFTFGGGRNAPGGMRSAIFGLGVKLAERGEVAVVAHVGMRGDAFGYFQLNDDVDGCDLSGPAEEMMEDGRGDVVRQVSVDVDFAGG